MARLAPPAWLRRAIDAGLSAKFITMSRAELARGEYVTQDTLEASLSEERTVTTASSPNQEPERIKVQLNEIKSVEGGVRVSVIFPGDYDMDGFRWILDKLDSMVDKPEEGSDAPQGQSPSP